MDPYTVEDFYFPVFGSIFSSELGILSGPGAEFFVDVRMEFISLSIKGEFMLFKICYPCESDHGVYCCKLL